MLRIISELVISAKKSDKMPEVQLKNLSIDELQKIQEYCKKVIVINQQLANKTEEDEEGFQKPAKVARLEKNLKLQQISTSNMYKLLEDNNEEESEMETENNEKSEENTPDIPVRTKKPPLLFVYETNTAELLKKITEITEKTTTYRMKMDHFTCQTNTYENFNSVKQYLKESEIEYYSYLPNHLKPIKAVIKYIHKSIPLEEIEEDLQTKNIKFMKINRLKIKNEMSNIIMITAPKEEANKIYNIKAILNCIVKIEPYKCKNTPQCYNCQQYGHASGGCSRATKCVKCAGNHRASECNLPTKTEAKCANCGQAHPANYRGCEVHKKFMAAQQAVKNKQTTTTMRKPINKQAEFPELPRKQPEIRETKETTNAEQKTKKKTQWERNENNKGEEENSLKEIIDLIKSLNIKKWIEKIKKITSELKKKTDPFEKILYFIETIDELL